MSLFTHFKKLKYLLYIFFLPVWYLIRFFPRDDNLWVFGSWYGEKFSDNSRALFDYCVNQKNKNLLKFVWLTRNNDVYMENKNSYDHFYKIWSLEGIWYSLRAKKIILSSGKADVNNFLINGAKIINLWHGAPMKKIGLDNKFHYNNYINIIQKYFYPFFYEFDIDYVLSTSDIFDKKLSKAFDLKIENILKFGYPRNDIFFNNTDTHKLLKNINKDLNNPKKIIYLPTFRENGDNLNLFEDYGFDFNNLNDFLKKNNSIFITKAHFADKYSFLNNKSSRIMDIGHLKNIDINFILKDVDILLTDYSGAYLDFLLTINPVIFTCFDFEKYITKSRELYFNYNEIISGPITKNWPQVLNSIDNILKNDNYFLKREQMNKMFNCYNDGKSCNKLYNFINSL